MSHESAYNKRLTPETKIDKIEALLEHLNLPPKALAFFRAHYRTIFWVLGIVIFLVVSWSLYDSHQTKKRQAAAAAFSLALDVEDSAMGQQLEAVIADYPGTSSATWAAIELGHIAMKAGDYSTAASRYEAVGQKVDKDDPLYPLIIFGIAQAFEADGKVQEAKAQYSILKDIRFFRYFAYTGLARLALAEGDSEGSIAAYNAFLTEVADDPMFAQARDNIETKIARAKARQ